MEGNDPDERPGESWAVLGHLFDPSLSLGTAERALVLLGIATGARPDALPPHETASVLGDSWAVLGYLLDPSLALGTGERALFLLGVALERSGGPIEEVLACLADPRWQMSDAERAVILLIAAALRPSTAIDAGTFLGGSAAGLSLFCDEVVTVDRDAERAEMVADLANVTFRCGTASDVVGDVLDEHPDCELVILDADHGTDGIIAEVTEVLRRPSDVLRALVIHDSAMETCRRGLEAIPWADTPSVRGVTLDFLPGSPNESGEVTGGMALVWLYSGDDVGPGPPDDR